MAGVLSRFSSATATTIQQLKNSSINENTVKSTAFGCQFGRSGVWRRKLPRKSKTTSRPSLLERFATENSVPPNKYWTEKRNSFAQLAAASAQKKVDNYPKKFSGRARNSVVKPQSP